MNAESLPLPHSRAALRATLALLAVTTLLLCASAARAATPKVSLNGAAPRPFYAFAHNPNTVEQATLAILAGANALEPDVSGYDGCPNADPRAPLVIAHGISCGDLDQNGFPTGQLTVADYLTALNGLAQQNPGVAEVVFDIKTSAAKPWRGAELARAVHEQLNVNGVQLNVFYSVSDRSDGAVFDQIIDHLGAREGVMVDEEDSVVDISNYFIGRGLYDNYGFADGTSQLGPNLPRAVDHGAFYRASRGYPAAVTYVWTLDDDASMDWFISAGVDGIIPDSYGFFGAPKPQDLGFLKKLLGVVAQHPEVRLATRDDNPFVPALQSYGLEIRTANTAGAGTDANLTFTLVGCKGEATITIDAGAVRPGYSSLRMIAGNTDWVTIPSVDLGLLSSITVSNDGSGSGSSWEVLDIAVSSAAYLGPNENNGHQFLAKPVAPIAGGTAVGLVLVPDFAEPAASIDCPANLTVPADPGLCGAVVAYSPVAQSVCGDATAVSSPASGNFLPVGTTQVTSYAQSATSPDSASCLFPVTVVDQQAPLVSCPPALTIDATGPAGAPLSWNNSAADNCPGVSGVVCDTAQGSVLGIGQNQISCAATDAAGNPGSCAFGVHVKGAGEQIVDLLGAIARAHYAPRISHALEQQLERFLAELTDTSKPHTEAQLCKKMEAFIDNLEQSPMNLEHAQLVAAANRIFAVLGCTQVGTRGQ